VEWNREGEVLPLGSPGEPDSLRAWRPWVLEDADGTLRMWYSGSDGTTSRILLAVRTRRAKEWDRQGIAIDGSFAGDSDSYGAESPCVVKTPGGYLMVYGGFDGAITRLHMATSDDARRWTSQGTIMQRGPEDAGGANHPCLLTTGERWWLFFTGYSDPSSGRGPGVVAAVSQTGASWDRVGAILDPETGEVGVSHPCVLDMSRTFYMFYASGAGGPIRIAMATSSNGLAWDRHGAVLEPAGEGPDGQSVHTPCVVRLQDGSIGMWYAGVPVGDQELGYRICFARFPGPWSP
jgi:predicted GH43/DUF377 family glycosyl hydrolase